MIENIAKHTIAMLLVAGWSTAHPDDLKKFLGVQMEQHSSVSWVMNNAEGNISKQNAMEIVQNVYKQAKNFGLNPKLLLAVIRTESGFKTKAVSSHGAVGLMQVMPKYHKDKIKGRSLKNPAVGIEVGATILNDCLVKHGSNIPKSLKCYSGGYGLSYSKTVVKYQASLNQHISATYIASL